MLSFTTFRSLFCVILVLTIMKQIQSFRLNENDHEEQPDGLVINPNDNENDNRLSLRSVLWPKICFKMYKDHYEHRRKRDNHSSQNSVGQLSQRPTRKCYPFDMK